ncbi:hypothetical protein KI688_006571 [Linnemannia hyalina]|uniref:Peptidase C1A papain C-terminal domain-containing protein n=1 Tax=Linnemannia hyalina TaxID=64524 RepID=A0A9P7XKG6_9FUNG|nr:hypothetical protein KI688_006571 [Linnemannia hyalina]
MTDVFDYGFGCEPTDPEEYNAYAAFILDGAPDDAPPPLPARVDLSDMMSPVKNQGPHSSCVSFAVCNVLDIIPNVVGLVQDESERFIWYNSKLKTAGEAAGVLNVGTRIPAAIAVAQQLGSCWEHTCPYDPSPLDAPGQEAFAEALRMKVTTAARLPGNTLDDYKRVLAAGLPVIVAFDIFGDREYRQQYLYGDAEQPGRMKMPPVPIPARTAGHAVLFVGYDDATELIKFKNSWGPESGDNGYYYMPYAYLQWTRDAFVVTDQEITEHPAQPMQAAPPMATAGTVTEQAVVTITQQAVTERPVEKVAFATVGVKTLQQEAVRSVLMRKAFTISEGRQPCDVYKF